MCFLLLKAMLFAVALILVAGAIFGGLRWLGGQSADWLLSAVPGLPGERHVRAILTGWVPGAIAFWGLAFMAGYGGRVFGDRATGALSQETSQAGAGSGCDKNIGEGPGEGQA
jgi:hypothetical protein